MGLSEDQLIQYVLEHCPHPLSPFGPGDDCALLRAGSEQRALTSDMLVEGTHFYRAHPPEALGFKSLAVNVSDVAAMGATPEAFTLSVALPSDLPEAWWRLFCQGLGACATASGVEVVGGDTVRSRHGLSISITAWGRLSHPPLRRDSAQPQDKIWVAGPIGRSGIGWERWESLVNQMPLLTWQDGLSVELADYDRCIQHHLRPEVNTRLGPAVAELGVRVGMDISDGLATDLPRLAKASQVDLRIDLDALPQDVALIDVNPITRAKHGEDYGLLITAPPHLTPHLIALGFHCIGEVLGKSSNPQLSWHLGTQVLGELNAAFAHF